MLNVIKLMGGLVLTAVSVSVFANPIAGTTCGAPEITGTLSSAAQCAYAPDANYDNPGTFGAADILHFYPGDTWTKVAENTATTSTGTDYFSASITGPEGADWGSAPDVNGEWGITDKFWDDFDQAVISIHVGGSLPDNWAWLMIDDASSGTWSLAWESYCDGLSAPDCNGGGISNIKLWGRGEGDVPEPGLVALLAIGLIGMVATRRKNTA